MKVNATKLTNKFDMVRYTWCIEFNGV